MPYSTCASEDDASDTAVCSCSSNVPKPGSPISGLATTARAPVVRTAAAIRSGWKYISTLVVTPCRSISAEAAVIATSMSSGVSRASRGHMTSRSQRSSGNPSPCPRNSTIGACECVLTIPGVSTPGSRVTSASEARRVGGGADPGDQPVLDVQHGIGDDGAGPVADDDGPGGESLLHARGR